MNGWRWFYLKGREGERVAEECGNPRSPEQKIAHFFESRTAKLRET